MAADHSEIEKLLKRAKHWRSGHGDAVAQFELGKLYETLPGMQDFKKASEYYAFAAAQGHAAAQCNLAAMYEEGRGVVQDNIKALELYNQAVLQQNLKAMYRLGLMHEFGQGVEKNLKKANELYDGASRLGYDKEADKDNKLRFEFYSQTEKAHLKQLSVDVIISISPETQPLSEAERKKFDEIILSIENKRCGKNLILTNMKLTRVQMQRLSLAVSKDQTLQQLYLSSNQIGDEEVITLSKALQINNTLQKLHITANQLGDAGTIALAKVLEINSVLCELELTHNKIGDAAALAMAKMLEVNKKLEKLELRHNKINSEGAAIAKSLERNQTLKYLDLQGNNIGEAVAIAFAKTLETNNTLQQLDLEKNPIGTGGVLAIAKMLEKNKTLKFLGLGENQINSDGVEAIAKALNVNQALEWLIFRENGVGDNGAIAFSKSLEKNKTLEKLFLSKNQIGDVGAKALAKAIGENNTLRKLDLWNNQIGDIGAAALAESLTINKKLYVLELNRNKIETVGGIALANALKANKTLGMLDLSNNQIEDVIVKAFEETFEINKTLASVNLTGNKINDELLKHLKEVFDKGRTNLLASVFGSSPVASPREGVLPAPNSNSIVQINVETWLNPETVATLKNKMTTRNLMAELQTLRRDIKQSQECVTQYQAQLRDLQKTMENADTTALEKLNGNARELEGMIHHQKELQEAEEERIKIFSDDKLSDFYYIFITQLTDAWFACKTIHSGMVKNNQKANLDYLAQGIDKLGDYIALPGVKFLTDIASKAITSWTELDKQEAINRMTNFFGVLPGSEGLINSVDIMIDALARKLTLTLQSMIIKIPTKQTGIIRRAWQAVQDLKNRVTANDVDNAIKEQAKDYVQRFITEVMQDKLEKHPKLSDVPKLVNATMGQSYQFQVLSHTTALTSVLTNALPLSPLAQLSQLSQLAMPQLSSPQLALLQKSALLKVPAQPIAVSGITNGSPINAATSQEVDQLRRLLEKQQKEQEEVVKKHALELKAQREEFEAHKRAQEEESKRQREMHEQESKKQREAKEASDEMAKTLAEKMERLEKQIPKPKQNIIAGGTQAVALLDPEEQTNSEMSSFVNYQEFNALKEQLSRVTYTLQVSIEQQNAVSQSSPVGQTNGNKSPAKSVKPVVVLKDALADKNKQKESSEKEELDTNKKKSNKIPQGTLASLC